MVSTSSEQKNLSANKLKLDSISCCNNEFNGLRRWKITNIDHQRWIKGDKFTGIIVVSVDLHDMIHISMASLPLRTSWLPCAIQPHAGAADQVCGIARGAHWIRRAIRGVASLTKTMCPFSTMAARFRHGASQRAKTLDISVNSCDSTTWKQFVLYFGGSNTFQKGKLLSNQLLGIRSAHRNWEWFHGT